MGEVMEEDEELNVEINMEEEEIEKGRILNVVKREIRGNGIRKEKIWMEEKERGLMDKKRKRKIIEKEREIGN